jgi:hypothetical protein
MYLSPKRVLQFKSLVKELYGMELTDQEAYDQSLRLLLLTECTLKEMEKEENQSRSAS